MLLQDDPLLKGIKGITEGMLCQEQKALCKSMHMGTCNAPIQNIVRHRDCFEPSLTTNFKRTYVKSDLSFLIR